MESVPEFVSIKLMDVNDTNILGDNALHCVWGNVEVVKLLVENGINIDQEGEGGFTPLKVADDFGHQEIVNYLISQGANAEVLSSEFLFDSEADVRHMKRLQGEIKVMEQKVESECGKNV